MSKKGKYLLGVVDSLMCQEFRKKVFTDVGNPDLQERCLDLLQQLKIDADILSGEKVEEIKKSEREYNRIQQMTAGVPGVEGD